MQVWRGEALGEDFTGEEGGEGVVGRMATRVTSVGLDFPQPMIAFM